MKTKQYLFALLVWAFGIGALNKYFNLGQAEKYEGWLMVSTVVSGIIVFAWYYSDSELHQYKRSKWLNIGVVALALLAVPYYLIRSRPQGKRGKALVKCFGFCVVALLSSVLGSAFISMSGFYSRILSTNNINLLVEKAEAGDAAIQFQLVKLFGQGIGTAKNPAKAKYWFGKAVENGYPEAQYWTGYKYYYGQDVPKDFTKALEWYEKSASQGYGPSQFMTGYIYQMGRLIDSKLQSNLQKAIFWYELAVQQDEMGAEFHLGCLKYFGLGMIKNQKEAELLILMASRKGQKGAQDFLENKENADVRLLQAICEINSDLFSGSN